MENIRLSVKNQLAKNGNDMGRLKRRDWFQGFGSLIFPVGKRRKGGREEETTGRKVGGVD